MALIGRLLEIVIEAMVSYLSAQIEAGAAAVMLCGSWAGVLSPRQFRSHVLRPTRAIVGERHRRHPGVPVIGFPCLAGLLSGEYVRDTGVRTVGLDTGTDIASVRSVVPAGLTLQGSLDAMRGWPCVFNLGHGIVPQTPRAHVAALLEQVHGA